MVQLGKNMEKVVGMNCYNCLFVSKEEKPVDPKIQNAEGGIDPKTPDELERARKADLITLPGGVKSDATTKKFCGHEKIQMFVTVRMCCAYWDNASVKRPWKKN